MATYECGSLLWPCGLLFALWLDLSTTPSNSDTVPCDRRRNMLRDRGSLTVAFLRLIAFEASKAQQVTHTQKLTLAKLSALIPMKQSHRT